MQVTNNKPVELSPVYNAVISGQFDPVDYLKNTIVKPIMTPLSPSSAVTFIHKNIQLDEDDLTQGVLNCLGDTMDAAHEAIVKDMFKQTLVYFGTTNLPIRELFVIQASKKEQLPEPSAKVIYTPQTDVIPACKEFLGGLCSAEKLFTSLAFYARPETLGFYFANEAAFDDFKVWLANETNLIASVLPAKTTSLFQQFQMLKLNELTESLILRNDDGDNNDEYSFARTLVALLMKYASVVQPSLFGVLPFNLGELFCPKSIVFVNVEKHARATSKQIAEEWDIINKSQQMKVNVVANNTLNKLTATVRNAKRIGMVAAVARRKTNKDGGVERSANVRFRKTAPTTVDLVKIISTVSRKLAHVARSENAYKSVKMSFAKPNRRNPDNYDLMGKIVSTKYRPDIHIYLDTSGSISERNYQDAIKALIVMARKMNVNLYFNSFSHVLSQCTFLSTKDKSVQEIYATFQKIPKVSGGTDFEQIWHYINDSPKRKRELSLIMTDFDYHPPNRYIKHPKNLYYIPVSHTDWKSIVSYAESFAQGMKHIDPQIRTKLLF